jgi:hypothetical protein
MRHAISRRQFAAHADGGEIKGVRRLRLTRTG